MNRTRLVYFGQSLAIFDWLILQADIDIVCVFTKTKVPLIRQEWMTRCALVHIRLFENIVADEISALLPVNLDLGICAHFDIIPDDVLFSFRLGVINIHPAPLPKYPGRYPLIDVCLAQSREGGVSLHWMTKDIDQGDLIAVKPFVIHPLESPIEVEARADQKACILLSEYWEGILNSYAPRLSQEKIKLKAANRLIPCPISFIDTEGLLNALNVYGPYGGMGLKSQDSSLIYRIKRARLVPCMNDPLNEIAMDQSLHDKRFLIIAVDYTQLHTISIDVVPTWPLPFRSQAHHDFRMSQYMMRWDIYFEKGDLYDNDDVDHKHLSFSMSLVALDEDERLYLP